MSSAIKSVAGVAPILTVKVGCSPHAPVTSANSFAAPVTATLPVVLSGVEVAEPPVGVGLSLIVPSLAADWLAGSDDEEQPAPANVNARAQKTAETVVPSA
jgi:hypothetical protein